MSEFNVRADSVNVEQIMDQIRGRIRDKRGVDYTEDQIRELASVKLEKFLDPRGIRSDLLEQFRKAQPPAPPIALYPFEDTTLFDSHRGIVRLFRRLLRPLMKLFFNANALAQSLHQQTIINRQVVDRLDAIDRRGDLYYELLHNLVLELTRATIEVKNVTMRVESISSRLDFNERRARALESVVVYKAAEPEARVAAPPSAPAPPPQRSGGSYPSREGQRYTPPAAARPPAQAAPSPASAPSAPAASNAAAGAAPTSASGSADAAVPGEGPGQRSRRRRRRRGRRGGASAAAVMGANAGSGLSESEARDTQAESSESVSGSQAQAVEPRDHAPSPAASSEPITSPPAPPPAAPSATEPPPSSAAHDDDDQ